MRPVNAIGPQLWPDFLVLGRLSGCRHTPLSVLGKRGTLLFPKTGKRDALLVQGLVSGCGHVRVSRLGKKGIPPELQDWYLAAETRSQTHRFRDLQCADALVFDLQGHSEKGKYQYRLFDDAAKAYAVNFHGHLLSLLNFRLVYQLGSLYWRGFGATERPSRQQAILSRLWSRLRIHAPKTALDSQTYPYLTFT